LVCSEFFRGIVYKVPGKFRQGFRVVLAVQKEHPPYEELHAGGGLVVLQNVQEGVQEGGLARSLASVKVEYNPQSVHAGNWREPAADDAFAQNATGAVHGQDSVLFLVENGACCLLYLE
jgi:hypothetical protein